MQIKCLAQGYNIQMPGFEQSTSEFRNQYSNHMMNVLNEEEILNVVLNMSSKTSTDCHNINMKTIIKK